MSRPEDTTRGEQEIRLNLGCGGRPLPGYVNVDLDPLEGLQGRYPEQEFPAGVEVYNFDILNLPFPDESIAEIRADSLIEHLGFAEEPKFFHEVKRVLRPRGLFQFSTPDFEDAVRLWLAARDEWKEFFRSDAEAIAKQHWFGEYSYSTENRWGYLMAMIFGNQNGAGQCHKNAYTVPKLRAILYNLSFEELEISHYRWKGDRDLMIQVKARKLG